MKICLLYILWYRWPRLSLGLFLVPQTSKVRENTVAPDFQLLPLTVVTELENLLLAYSHPAEGKKDN